MSSSKIMHRATRRGFCKAMAFAIPMATGLALSGAPAAAQGYPTKPIRIVVPFGAGGVADITVRIVTDKLGDKLGQRFIIENQPGPGGINAARSVLSGGNDGYNLALFSNGTAVSVNMFKDLRFDPLKDFTPISTLGYFDFILGDQRPVEVQDAQGFRRLRQGKSRQAQRRHRHRGQHAEPVGRIVQDVGGTGFPHRAVPQYARSPAGAHARRRRSHDRFLRLAEVDVGGQAGPRPRRVRPQALHRLAPTFRPPRKPA